MVGDEDPPRIPLTYPSTFPLFSIDTSSYQNILSSADPFAVSLQFQKGPEKYPKGLMIECGYIDLLLDGSWN